MEKIIIAILLPIMCFAHPHIESITPNTKVSSVEIWHIERKSGNWVLSNKKKEDLPLKYGDNLPAPANIAPVIGYYVHEGESRYFITKEPKNKQIFYRVSVDLIEDHRLTVISKDIELKTMRPKTVKQISWVESKP